MTVTASEAVRGNAGIVLKLDGTDYSGDVKSCNLNAEDRDDADVTFAEAAAGDASDYTVALRAIQSTAAGSLWRYLWDNAGDEVPLVYGPHGNAVPSADKPHFTATVKLGARPSIGGDARRTKDRNDFEASLEVLDAVTLVEV